MSACLLLAALVAADVSLPGRTTTCDSVQFGGELAECDDTKCLVRGEVFLVCNDLRLWGDQVEIRFDDERNFAGASASGNVLLVDGTTVVTCDQVELAPDRITGTVKGATVRVKKKPKLDARGVPQGKDASVFHGDIRRPSAKELVVTGGDFTLCDCGGGDPSWRIDSPEIEVELGERALLWWPMLYINPFDLGLVPVTPPLLPISIPLRGRAWGMLPPKILFFGPYPTVDLPVFIPLGDSWDVTVAPGMRTDWVNKPQVTPARWGAPRLGARLRYAPHEAISGELRAQWTWDRRQFVAGQFRRSYQDELNADVAEAEAAVANATTPAELGDAQRQVDAVEARAHALELERVNLASLIHRVTVTFNQDVNVGEDLRWLTDVEWLSDDNVRRDFALGLVEQVVNYVPSRTQLVWRPQIAGAGLVASLRADYLLRIGNTPDQKTNTRGGELHVPHRGPAARLTLLPWAPFEGALSRFSVDADARFARYGSWDPTDPVALVSGGGEVGVSYRDRAGPISFNARLAGHGYGADAGDLDAAGVAFVHASADAKSTWARRYGELTHTITPRLSYRAILARRRTNASIARDLQGRADESLDIKKFQQLQAEIAQSIWRRGRRLVELSVRVPIELAPPEFIAVNAALRWSLGPWGSGEGWITVAPDQPTETPDQTYENVQALGATANLSLGPLRLSATYVRFAPSAERFNRDVYALAGTIGETPTPEQWSHAVTPAVSFTSKRWKLSYRAVTLLPQPGAAPLVPGQFGRPYVRQHRIGARYTSACECWDAGVTATFPGFGTTDEVASGLRLLVSISVGGYSVAGL